MSVFMHHAIVITSSSDDCLRKAKRKARKLGLKTTEIIKSDYYVSSFMVPPDGSQEGWTPSYEADKGRRKLMKYCKKKLSVDAVEVEFGGDYSTGRIVDATAPNDKGIAGRIREEQIL